MTLFFRTFNGINRTPRLMLARRYRQRQWFWAVWSELGRRAQAERYAKTNRSYSIPTSQTLFVSNHPFSRYQTLSISNFPLLEIVDDVIQSCPIDARRPLYKNIVLSGEQKMIRSNTERKLSLLLSLLLLLLRCQR